MNYQYFTAFDMKYAWWATHLASSIFKNSPDSNFTAFLIAKKSEEDSEEVEGTIEIIQQANPNCRVELTIIKDDIDYDTLKRFCAGFRTHIFGDARDEYFDTNDALVWIDADSIVRNDLKELEDFCENNDFDVSARPKNTKYKYASGLIIQKPTIHGKNFGIVWNQKWSKRFEEEEWTADQNAFNDAVSYLMSRNKISTMGAPKSFCDVWLSDNGLIWQAKHQTKMKKVYVDEMAKNSPEINDSLLWNSIREEFSLASIDTFKFTYNDLDFEFMGLDGEDIFEEIKRTGTFYNIDYLEALGSLENNDALFIVGGGIQNDNAYLTAFTNVLMSVNFEPNLKMIDIGLRNGQNNPGASRSVFTEKPLHPGLERLGMKKDMLVLFLNWKTSSNDAVAAISKNIGKPERFKNGKWRYGAAPEDLDFANNTFLRNGKYKSVRKLKYASDTPESVEKFIKVASQNPESSTSLSMEFDEIASLIYQEVYMNKELSIRKNILSPFSKGEVREGYDFSKFVGMILINVYDYSVEILETAKETIEFFYPNIGIVVYDERDIEEQIQRIEEILGENYEKIYDKPDQIEKTARCLLYKSLRREK